MDVRVLMPAKLRCRTLFVCVSASSVAAHYFPPELRASFEPPEYADESLSIASMEEGGKQGSYIVGMLRLVRRGSCLNETGSRVERCEGGLARDAHQSALPKSGVPFSTRMFASAQPERDHLRCIGAAPLCIRYEYALCRRRYSRKVKPLAVNAGKQRLCG